MAARSLWNGAIRFGLVNVPIKVYSAASSKQIRFRELHVKEGAALEHRRVCAKEDKEVPFDEVVRGYETSPGRYVVLTKDEIQAPARERGKTIDLEDFVPADQIDPVFYDSPYWLGPQKDSDDAYAVLLAALERTGLVGIGRFALRTREQLVALYPVDGALRISTMRFHDEVIDDDELDLPQPSKKVSDREAKMADALVSSLATEFDPTEYEDTYRERVLEVVEAKAQGRQIVAPQAAAEDESTDLMALLEQSVSGARKTKKPKAKARKSKASA
ncbi:MAG: end-binding protein Ku [Thermoleophilaceae bacterium]|jgi:DNA end-binding protein Ku|nr:end-binding protein Ku [Thermoleophilaceae bacterium]